jgi:hypothetical protein
MNSISVNKSLHISCCENLKSQCLDYLMVPGLPETAVLGFICKTKVQNLSAFDVHLRRLFLLLALER